MYTVNSSFRRDLGDGLVLRWSTIEDTERIATLHGLAHREQADAPLNAHYIRQIRGLMKGDYPLMGPEDFGIIEDISKEGNPIVAWASNPSYLRLRLSRKLASLWERLTRSTNCSVRH